MPSRRPILIFDFGNVFAFFNYALACNSIGHRLGLSGEVILQDLRGRGLFTLVQDYETGSITSEEFSKRFGQLAGQDIPYDEFSRHWSDIFRLNEPVADLVRGLKARGYTLLLGSNTNELHATQFRRQFREGLASFDRLVLSYEIGHLKPSPDFYLACARAADAGPGECVFIDDLPENVEGARAVGMAGVLYQDMPTLTYDLRRLGVDLPGPS